MFSPFDFEIFGQLALAAFLGALIGIERKIAGKGAGMRTFALVAMGSALFSIVSVNALKFIEGADVINFDPTRIAAQIVTGVGFIGAGIIIFSQSKLRGVTTAAGLWLASAIGLAVGFKFFAAAIFATVIAIFILTFLWIFEERFIERLPYFRRQESEDDSE